MGDNILNTPGLMDPSTEFGNIMQHAMKIKSAQMDQERKKFETWPLFLQNTMWLRNEDALALRELPVGERMAGAAKLKEEGNAQFRKKHYGDAIEMYEAAAGCFRYAKQLDPDWKKKGIKDETIELREERGEGETADAINELLVSCYSNLAACYVARAAAGRPEPGGSVEQDYRLCVHASTYALDITPRNPKALYRRARGLSEPMTASDDDIDRAIADLGEAAVCDPDDKAVRALLSKLKRTRAEAHAKAKEGFSGLFGKAELYDAKTMAAQKQREEAERRANDPNAGEPRTAEDCEREAKEAEAAVAHLLERGRHEDARELQKKVEMHRAQLADYKKAVAEKEEEARRHDPRFINFSNPTDEQVADAKKHGIDLFDPMVVRELQRLQKEKEFGGEEDDNGDDADDDSGGGARHPDEQTHRSGARSGSEGEVPALYRGKMHNRLERMRRQGIGGGTPAGPVDAHQHDDAPSGLHPRTRTVILVLALAIGFYRVWSVLSPQMASSEGTAAMEEGF